MAKQEQTAEQIFGAALDLPPEQSGGSFSDMFRGLGLRKSMTFDDAVKKVGSVPCVFHD